MSLGELLPAGDPHASWRTVSRGRDATLLERRTPRSVALEEAAWSSELGLAATTSPLPPAPRGREEVAELRLGRRDGWRTLSLRCCCFSHCPALIWLVIG